MRSALTNMFNLAPQNIVMEVYLMLVLVWLMVLVGAIWSIWTTERTGTAKVIWCTLVVLFPAVGLLLYALWCVTKLDILILKSRTPKSSSTPRRAVNRGDRQDGDYADAAL